MTETIVITGGNGFVGRHLQAEIKQVYPDATLVIWDQPDVDITQPETYQAQLEKLQPAWIIHLAAFANAGQSFDQADLVHAVNVVAARQLLELTRTSSPNTKLIIASSSDIYGTTAQAKNGDPIPELPLDEAMPTNPYGESKLEMEKIIAAEFNDRVIRVRPFPHIGPGQRTGFVAADFAAQIAAIEKGEQAPVIKVGNLEAARDFTDVRDTVKAYCLLMEKGVFGQACPATEHERGVCGVYHVASGKAIKISDLLNQLLALSNQKITVEQDPSKMRPSDIPILVGDAGKLKTATGWQPEIPLSQTLQDILNDWRERM